MTIPAFFCAAIIKLLKKEFSTQESEDRRVKVERRR
jgi:hypothetical protein